MPRRPIQCFRYTRRGASTGRCQEIVDESDIEEDRKEQFCKKHNRFCRQTYDIYKDIQRSMKVYVSKRSITGRYDGNSDRLFQKEDLWGFTKSMIARLTATMKNVIRLRRVYSSLCVGGENPPCPTHLYHVNQLVDLLRVIRQPATVEVPDALGDKDADSGNKREKKRLVKEMIEQSFGRSSSGVVRTRNNYEYSNLKKYFEKAYRKYSKEEGERIRAENDESWDNINNSENNDNDDNDNDDTPHNQVPDGGNW